MIKEEEIIDNKTFIRKLAELAGDKSFLVNELMNLIESLNSLESKLGAHALKRSEIEGVMESWDNTEMLKITSEQIDGKFKFTNELQRKAALKQRQSESKDYLEFKNQLNKKIEEETADKILFNYLDRKLKAIRSIMDFISGRGL